MSKVQLGDALRIFQTGNAAAYAEALFRDRFGAPFPTPRVNSGLSIPTPPENWRQYVALYKGENSNEEAVGFCNWIKHGNVYLEGGMCVKESVYRRMPREHFLECRRLGGIAQMMMATAATELVDCDAWFGYCGDPKALAVDLRAGYERTKHPYLIVKWFRPLPEASKGSLIESIAAIGPF